MQCITLCDCSVQFGTATCSRWPNTATPVCRLCWPPSSVARSPWRLCHQPAWSHPPFQNKLPAKCHHPSQTIWMELLDPTWAVTETGVAGCVSLTGATPTLGTFTRAARPAGMQWFTVTVAEEETFQALQPPNNQTHREKKDQRHLVSGWLRSAPTAESWTRQPRCPLTPGLAGRHTGD